MTTARILRFYLDDQLRQSAQAGAHNFIGKIAAVVEGAGFRVEYLPNTPVHRTRSATLSGYAMFHMEDPVHDRSLTMRRVYAYPFWAIEPTAQRWDWRVAKTIFQPAEVTRKPADRFYRFWQDRLFGDAPSQTTRDGFVYVPLQGRLTKQRSFQHCSPIDMVRHVLSHDDRPVVATLHPKETYSGVDHSALSALAAEHPRLTIQTGGMDQLLQGCDYVVTQNSSAAFFGYFFGKPCVLFAKSDFHHIASSVYACGVENALTDAPDVQSDYAGYLHWFWQVMSINAGRPEAEDQIAQALRRAGWPI
jgi:hypothetical protein